MLSLPEANKLVAAWAKANRPEVVGWHETPPLIEVTTAEIRKRLGVQVYKLDDYTHSVGDPCAFMLKDGKVFPMGIGFGGDGLESMIVADLNQDSSLELVYTYSWGSGLHRTHFAAFTFGGKVLKLETAWQYANYAVRLDQKSDYVIDLVTTSRAGKDVRLGSLTLTTKRNKLVLDAAFDKSLDNTLSKNILRWKQGS